MSTVVQHLFPSLQDEADERRRAQIERVRRAGAVRLLRPVRTT